MNKIIEPWLVVSDKLLVMNRIEEFIEQEGIEEILINLMLWQTIYRWGCLPKYRHDANNTRITEENFYL